MPLVVLKHRVNGGVGAGDPHGHDRRAVVVTVFPTRPVSWIWNGFPTVPYRVFKTR